MQTSPGTGREELAAAMASMSAPDAVAAVCTYLRGLPSPARGLAGGGDAVLAAALLELRDAATAGALEHVAALDADHAFDATPALHARSWLRQTARLADAEAGRMLALARRLHTDPARPLPAVAAAVGDGLMSLGQAQAVCAATRRAPVEVLAAVEAAVVESGAHLLPDELGRHVGAVVRRMSEQAAPLLAPGDPAAERFVRVRRGFDGWFHLEGLLEPDAGAQLLAALDVLAAPVPAEGPDGQAVRDPRTAGQRRHDGLVTLAGLFCARALTEAAAPPDAAPAPPAPRAVVQVVLEADAIAALVAERETPTSTGPPAARRLRELPGDIGRTTDGVPLPGPAAEHLACDAVVTWALLEHLPAVGPEASDTGHAEHDALREAVSTSLRAISPALGGTGAAVLDAGRSRRLASGDQRRAAAVRDRGCVVSGCTMPAWLCELHHVVQWLLGGSTDLGAMALVCPGHHRFLHRYGWSLAREAATGRYLLVPPTRQQPIWPPLAS